MSEVAVRIIKGVRRPTGRRPTWLRTPPLVVDLAIAGGFLAAQILDRVSEPVDSLADSLLAWTLTAIMTASLCARRHWPMAAVTVGSIVIVCESVFGVASVVSPYGSQILVYSAGLYATRARSRWVPPLTVVSVVAYFSGTASSDRFEPIGVLFVWLATWAVGYSTARRREEQDAARRAIRRQVIAEEESRMARELHDVIGHTVNLLVVQAGAARLSLESDVQTARELLAEMESGGREALSELDQVLSTLRHDEGRSATDGRLPGLAQLPDLVARMRDSQIDVRLALEPGDRPLPAGLELSAYRVVQEALTNVLKHAAPCTADVRIWQHDGLLSIDVTDDGPGPPQSGRAGQPGRAGEGRGLLGMTERIAACGGTLRHGRGAMGGYLVHADIPLS